MSNNIPKENVTGYRIIPVTEMRINPDGKTATTVEIKGNTNQVNVEKLKTNGKVFYIITGSCK
jgi:bacillopeptidase F (M6 metalloprotease family)